MVTGGTGVFEGATGEIHSVGYVTNTTAKDVELRGAVPASIVFEGLVEY
jgi:hypothetical protein